jgi:hypothetical protein
VCDEIESNYPRVELEIQGLKNHEFCISHKPGLYIMKLNSPRIVDNG